MHGIDIYRLLGLRFLRGFPYASESCLLSKIVFLFGTSIGLPFQGSDKSHLFVEDSSSIDFTPFAPPNVKYGISS
jgi:hypothetical protein